MNLRYIYTIISFLIASNFLYAQSTVFDYEVVKLQNEEYEVSFQFYAVIDFQFIQIDLYDQDQLIGSHEAIINRKSDNNYYLFFNNEEQLVYMDDLKVIVNNTYGNPNVVHQFIEVRLLDRDFKLLETNRKEIR